MRSIPGAMIWELLYRGRWMLAGGMLGANAMPLLIEGALARDGAIDATDGSQIMMHMVLVQMNLFLFGFAVMWAQDKPSRLYAAPITTTTLVAWYLIPAMFLMWLESVISTLLLNAMFALNWPIWGPALFAAAAVTAIYAAVWQTQKTGWVIVSLGSVAFILGIWFKSRYGSMFGQSTYYWRELTVIEVATLLAFGALSFYAAVTGIARDRRGDVLQSLGIIAWLERIFDPPPAVGAPFRSAEDAQFWSTWAQKGWAMPICVVFGALMGVTGWSIFDRKAENLIEGFEVGGILLGVIGMLGGLIIGNCGPNDSTFEMGNFLATRPMNTKMLSRIMLKTMIRSVLASWFLWVAMFGLVYLIVLASGYRPEFKIVLKEPGLWFIPLSLLAPWVVTTVGAALGLTGRSWPLGILFFTSFFLFFIGVIVSQMLLSRESQIVLVRAIWGIAGFFAILMTVIAYLAARRRGLIDSAAVYTAGFAWLLFCVPVIYYAATHADPIQAIYVVILGLLALAVAPFSTVPLALNWNRVR